LDSRSRGALVARGPVRLEDPKLPHFAGVQFSYTCVNIARRRGSLMAMIKASQGCHLAERRIGPSVSDAIVFDYRLLADGAVGSKGDQS